MIREFRLEDAPQVMDLAEQFHKESRYHDYDFDRQKIIRLLAESTVNEDLLNIVAVDDNGVVRGGLCARATAHYFGNNRVAQDLWLFVEPSRRGGRHALELVERYIEWARERDCVEAIVSTSTGISEEKTLAFLEKAGFKRIGSITVRRV